VERPLWREDGSVVYNCCCSSPAQSFSGPIPAGLKTISYCLRFGLPQPGGPGPRIYIRQEQRGPVIPPGTGFPFRHLLRLAGLRWRYWNPSPRGGDQPNYTPPYIAPARTAQKTSLVLLCSVVAGKTTCPQTCSLAVVLSPLYTALTWQWVCMSVLNCATYGRWSLGSSYRGSRWTHGTFVP
jgi:hypothetical protein